MTLIQADAFHLPYPDKLFHACVTSPPYWGLRRYAGDQGEEPLGLEATPERHIERMVECFREVRRVLRDDGVVWLNYGDCYAGSGGAHTAAHSNPGISRSAERGGIAAQVLAEGGRTVSRLPIPAGNLMLMPHRLAIALQDDGWIVRNDLVWFKRNPMPESVAGWRWERKKVQTGREPADWDALPKGWDVGEGSHDQIGKGNYREDENRERTVATFEYGDDYVLRKSSWRHTRAHEYVFQLVKKMSYFCNQEVVREPSKPESYDRTIRGVGEGHKHINGAPGQTPHSIHAHRRHGDGYEVPSGRNPRSVLDVPTAPYKGAHYATFPPKLIAPLIRASVPRRCCPKCGTAWAPVVEKIFVPQTDVSLEKGIKGANEQKPAAQENRWDGTPRGSNQTSVTDYRPTCECGIEEYEPGIVLDIFGGSGTTGMVAKQLLRRWVVMDISRPYLDEQSKIRTGTGTPSNALEGLPLFEDTEC